MARQASRAGAAANPAKTPGKKSAKGAKAATRRPGKSAVVDQAGAKERLEGGAGVGAGGETHQTAPSARERLTTAQGIPVSDNQNSLRVGPRGPLLMQDFALREKLFHFDHERIPERVVHARGYGAHGTFETLEDLSDITRADIFQRPGEQTEVFVRFSTVAGNKGSFDLARDVRGFAVKFYTKEGNWDLVGNNIPVFFIQDAIKFPDLVHSVKEAPDRAFPQAQSAHDNFWDFVSLMPESTHMLLWVMSDRAIPRSFRTMEGFGVHTFRFVNAEGRSTFVKFHWKPAQGLQSVVWNEAVKINGADPDFHRRDLWDAITKGTPPQWDLGLQVFDDEFADAFDFDVLDPTKIIPEELVPVRIVGRMTLDRVVDNDFAETEQVAFCTQNVVPGIDFTNDPLLQGRNFSYLDTQLKRLGSPNFTQLPVNAPRCPVAHFQRDGHMQMSVPTGRANFEPNSWEEDVRGPREDPVGGHTAYPDLVSGEVRKLRPESFADHYSQARQFFVSQTPVEQQHIIDAFTFELSKCDQPRIRERMVSNLRNVHEDLAGGVAAGLGMPLPDPSAPAVTPRTDLDPSPALSIVENGPGSFAGRKLGILVTDGSNASVVSALQSAVKKAGAMSEIVAPTVTGVILNNGKLLPGDQMIDGGPSVLYDAVAVLPSATGVQDLLTEKPALDFVNDAYAHCKFIGVGADAGPLLEAAGVADKVDEGFVQLTRASAAGFIEQCGALRFWDRPH